MTDFVTQQSIEEFTKLLNFFNISLKSVEFNQDSFDVQMYGSTHKVQMPGQAEVEMSMIASTPALNTFMEMVKELEKFDRLKLNSHPAVQDQYKKLIEIAELAKGDDSACDPS